MRGKELKQRADQTTDEIIPISETESIIRDKKRVRVILQVFKESFFPLFSLSLFSPLLFSFLFSSPFSPSHSLSLSPLIIFCIFIQDRKISIFFEDESEAETFVTVLTHKDSGKNMKAIHVKKIPCGLTVSDFESMKEVGKVDVLKKDTVIHVQSLVV